MNKITLLIILFSCLFLTTGCMEEERISTPHSSENSEGLVSEGQVIEVTELEQINEALADGPVLLKLGAEWCGPCKAMKPLLAEIAVTYKGRAAVMSADIDESPQLAAYFGVYNIPDSCVIVGFENGKYTYMQQDGNVTADRFSARILGMGDKETYEKRLDLALGQAETGKAGQKNESSE